MSEVIGRFAGHRDPKVEELAHVPLFRGVPRRQLALLAANLDEVTADRGETLVREGHHNDAFWILLDGEVELVVGGVRPHMLGPGGFFGAASMLDGHPATATVVSRTPIRALVASSAQFRALEGNETVLVRVMSAALERLREDLEIHRAAHHPPGT